MPMVAWIRPPVPNRTANEMMKIARETLANPQRIPLMTFPPVIHRSHPLCDPSYRTNPGGVSPATRNNIYRGLRHYCFAFFLAAIPMSEIVARSPTAHPVVARTRLGALDAPTHVPTKRKKATGQYSFSR